MRSILSLLAFSLTAAYANPVPDDGRIIAHLEAAPTSTSTSTSTLAHPPLPLTSLNLTSPAPAAAPNPILYVCSAADCGGSCFALGLLGLGQSNCFLAVAFVSLMLSDPTHFFAPNVVDVAPQNCQDWLSIPQQGVCYNLIGQTPFHQYGSFH